MQGTLRHCRTPVVDFAPIRGRVAGARVWDWLKGLASHGDAVSIPSKATTAPIVKAYRLLADMADESDDARYLACAER